MSRKTPFIYLFLGLFIYLFALDVSARLRLNPPVARALTCQTVIELN